MVLRRLRLCRTRAPDALPGVAPSPTSPEGEVMASPLKIMIGLHYWTTPTEYSADNLDHWESEGVQDAIADFVNAGMLKKREGRSQYGSSYEGTDALRAWVEALCNVRWPVQVWVVPRDDVGEVGK